MVDFETAIRRLVKGGIDLTPRQLLLLMECSEGPRTVRALAAAMNVSKPAISRAVDKLVAAEFVRRNDDPADRRSVLMALRPNGTEFLARLMSDEDRPLRKAAKRKAA